MKLNMFYPPMGSEKCFEFDDIMLQPLYDKRMSQEVSGDFLGDMFKGYIFRISGGNDKQGFPMKQGVLVNHRVRLLLSEGSSCYRIRKTGERRRKSVRGCIVGPDLSVLNLIIINQGEKPIPGLTDAESAVPRRRGPKRASTIRKLFNLTKKDDVKKYVIRREFVNKKGKKIDKAPKIQRLVTPDRLRRKRQRQAEKKESHLKSKLEAQEYHKLLERKAKELKSRRASSIAKRLQSRQQSGVPAAKAQPKVDKEVKTEKMEKETKPKAEKKVEKKVEKKLEKKEEKKVEKKQPAKQDKKQVKPPATKKQTAKKEEKSTKKETQKPGGKVVAKVESKVTEKAVTKPAKVEKKPAQPKQSKKPVDTKEVKKPVEKQAKPVAAPKQAAKPVEKSTKPAAPAPAKKAPVAKPVAPKPAEAKPTQPKEAKPKAPAAKQAPKPAAKPAAKPAPKK